jgi:glycosyltransferase involved in cell wall biosynthesis
MPPLTILQLAANRWWTGSADPIIRLLVGLKARGHRVLLGVIPGDRFEAKAREAGLAPLPGLALEATGPGATIGDVLQLRRIVHAEKVQIVHANHSHDHWLGAFARSRAMLVRTFHNLRAVRRGPVSGWLYGRTDAAVAVSAQIAARCVEIGFGPERLWRIAGAADLPRFEGAGRGDRVREEFKLGDAPVVGSVARLAPNRGHESLIAGFRLLLESLPEARLLLVGKGEARPGLEARIAELGLADRVLFTGYRDHDLPDVLAALDCFALMGAGSDESCRAALEAMAAGRPVVARRVGALPETVVDGETGFLLDDDRPETVAHALAAVLSDRSRAARMGAAGLRRVRDGFSPDRYVDDMERVYYTLIDRR